ncbi:MAG: sulfatase-like hydrolase/transferase [Cyclobacteriaceae bacterium]|nr:sulfatase-like hydrolase/transferase [Cyclobacteriaceae bacterium]
MDKKPNFILFLIDDFGYADISYEGNSQIRTPSIDRIAENGAHFTRFYQSGAACAPTRASLLTGRYHLATGVWGVHAGRDFIHRDESTMADILQNNGYVTGAFGKWHSGKTWSYFSWNRGFDVGVHSRLYQYFDTQVIYNNKIINVDGPITNVIGDQVIRFIEENKDNPFFAYVPFQSIHEPYNCPPEVFQGYKEAGYSDHVARLYGMIEVMDLNIGRILNRVDQLGLTENTVILFLSDDGPSPGFDLSYSNRRMNEGEKAERTRAWPKQLRGGKGSIWEGGSITPFYIQWKGKIKPGMEFSQLSGVIDVFPTMLDIAGLKIPEGNLPVHGRSFWPVIQGEEPDDWNERRYFDNTNFYLIERHQINMEKPEMHHIALHYQQYKLIRADNTLYGGPDTVYYELYDLVADPLEKTDIIKDKPDIAAMLIPEIESWYSDIIGSGRAFTQAVYEVGNWEETSTPINLDAVLELKGPVKRSDNSTTRYDNWTRPGSAMRFEIDVAEEGAYQVELGYACEPSNLGSFFHIYTSRDTAGIRIEDNSTALSGTLLLPSGRQVLTVELVSLGRGTVGVDVMNRIVMHRIPEEKDNGVLRDAGMEVYTAGENRKKFFVSSASADFMFGGRQQEPLEVRTGEKVTIQPFAGNEDQIRKIILYDGFEVSGTLEDPPWKFSLYLEKPGLHTVNVEFVSVSGVMNAVHGDILVK